MSEAQVLTWPLRRQGLDLVNATPEFPNLIAIHAASI